MLIAVQVWKFSPVWLDFGPWQNWYLVESEADDDAQRDLAMRCLHLECDFHQSHVQFSHVVTAPDALNGTNQFGDGGDVQPDEHNRSRYWVAPGNLSQGVQISDPEPNVRLGLFMSKAVPRGRRGASFYRGVLNQSHCIFYDKNGVTLARPDIYERRFEDALLAYFAGDVTQFFVKHGGQQRTAWGAVEHVTRFYARGANLMNASTRVRSRVPQHLRESWVEIQTALRTARLARDDIQGWQAIGTPFNPVSLKSSAQAIMEASLAVAMAARLAVTSDFDGACTGQPFLITRYGPTSAELHALSGAAVQNDCEDMAPSSAYQEAQEDLAAIQPDVSIGQDEFYSQQALADMMDIVEKFYNPAQAIGRGDFLLPRPK